MTAITRESWKDILRSAMAILRSLDARGFARPDLAMGGGTVLMFRFEHRLSRDIDLFVSDVQYLSIISPRLNDFTASLVSDYAEQANAVKLVLPHGDIDFVAAAPAIVGDTPGQSLEFEGEQISLESTAEILGKKLLYRAESFMPRDAFDLAIAMEIDNDSAAKAVRAAASKAPVLDRRMDELGRLSPDDLQRDILILEPRRQLSAEMVTRVRQFIRSESVA
jgi:hypothetical protein